MQQTVHGFFNHTARRCCIKAHKSDTFFAEYLSVIECKTSLLNKKAIKFRLGKMKFAAIQKDQIGGLRNDSLDDRKIIPKK